ncbi:MAG: hypothetical protein KAV97_04525 [Actinomycetia bacterium]|nr:hypothetical protein [Actinomycetes bacterium]
MENLLKYSQMIFYVVIGTCTAYNLWLTRKQSNLVFKPFIGVMDIKTTRMLIDINKKDVYENVKCVKIDFVIKNVGNLPAKNFKIKTIGKIGNIILPHEEDKKNEGGTILPQQVLINTAIIGKDVIDGLVERKEKLRYEVELFYSDWENYQQYNYSSYFDIFVINKNPLHLASSMLPKIKF